MLSANELKNDILNDMRVELSDEFDRNFERKAFFTEKWKPRAHDYPKGSLLIVTGAMRRSTQGRVEGNGVRFSSALAYAEIHNEGGTGRKPVKSHTRRSRKGKTYTVRAHTRKFTMPKRQFIGDGPETQRLIRNVIEKKKKKYNLSLTNFLKK